MQNNSISNTLIENFSKEIAGVTLEARVYIAHREFKDRQELTMQAALRTGYNYTRIACRVIRAMGWVNSVKALMNGEISPEQFISYQQYELTDNEACDLTDVKEEDLHKSLKDLLDKSYLLYMRVKRLNQMIRENIEAGKVINFENSQMFVKTASERY